MMSISRNDIKGNYSEELITNICFMVAEVGDFLAFVKKYMYDYDPIVVRNALCALTKATDEELSQLNPIREELIDMAIKCNNSSIRRALLVTIASPRGGWEGVISCFEEQSVINACKQFQMAKVRKEPCPFSLVELDNMFAKEK